MSNWTNFVKEFARKHNVSYGCAMAMPECSIEYKKLHPKKPTKKQSKKAVNTELLEKYPAYAEEKQRKREVESMGMEDEDIYPTIENPTIKDIELKTYLAKTGEELDELMERIKKFVVSPEFKKISPYDKKSLDHSIETIGNKKYARFEASRKAEPKENIRMVITEKTTRGRKKKYATAEEAHKAKLEKTKESTKRKREAKKAEKGKGIFDPFTKVAKYAKDKVIAPVQQSIQSTTDTATALVYGRKDLPPNVRDILSKYGDLPIQSITLGRTPVPSAITGAINAVSLGQFAKKFASTPYDKLFHLFIIFGTSQGKFLFEKNAVINATTNIPNNADLKTIAPVPQGLTMNAVMDNTRRLMGDKFLPYSAVNNNCQDFISSILRSNNIGTSDDLNWVKQDTEQLFSNQSFLQRFTNNITDLGAKVDVLQQGAGVNKKDVLQNYDMMLKHLTAHIADPTEPIDPKDYKQSKKIIDAIKKVKSGNGVIDFEDMKWGSFSNQLKVYNAQHNTNLDLHQFAMKILANPKDYKARTEKRARFYLNVLDKKKSNGNIIMPDGKKPNKWIDFVKQFASKNNMKYNEAIKHPATKAHYKTGKGAKKLTAKQLQQLIGPVGAGMPTSKEDYIAEQYSQSQLGAEGGKHYISL